MGVLSEYPNNAQSLFKLQELATVSETKNANDYFGRERCFYFCYIFIKKMTLKVEILNFSKIANFKAFTARSVLISLDRVQSFRFLIL